MRILRLAFVGAAVAWAVAVPLATWAATRSHAPSVAYALALIVYGVGSVVCHQLPERSFHLWGAQMPVCARCTGIYLGAAIVAVVSVARGFPASARPRLPRASARPALLLALALTLATLVFEWTTGQAPANWVRALAGALLGGAVAWVVVAAAQSARDPRESK